MLTLSTRPLALAARSASRSPRSVPVRRSVLGTSSALAGSVRTDTLDAVAGVSRASGAGRLHADTPARAKAPRKIHDRIERISKRIIIILEPLQGSRWTE